MILNVFYSPHLEYGGYWNSYGGYGAFTSHFDAFGHMGDYLDRTNGWGNTTPWGYQQAFNNLVGLVGPGDDADRSYALRMVSITEMRSNPAWLVDRQKEVWGDDMYANGYLTNKYGELNQVGDGRVGQPGELESVAPVWGSGRSAIDHLQQGNYWRGLGYTALAVSDIFLVRSIATGIGKGAWKLGSHTWSATRKWMLKTGYTTPGQPLHHWAITQATAKKYGLQGISNQPWNLVNFTNQSLHIRAGHGMGYLGEQGFKLPGQIWYGTPTWFKSGVVSYGGRGIFGLSN